LVLSVEYDYGSFHRIAQAGVLRADKASVSESAAEAAKVGGLSTIYSNSDPRELASEMVNIAKDFTGSRLEDDIAIVVLKLAIDGAGEIG